MEGKEYTPAVIDQTVETETCHITCIVEINELPVKNIAAQGYENYKQYNSHKKLPIPNRIP